ncbi:MAG: hypothetical protein ACYTG3_13670 [Planctomycetota bacterium]|jgi:hypothetical protein
MILIRACTLLLVLTTAAVAADVVVLRDRTLLEGAVTKGAKTLSVDGQSYPLTEVLLWENGEGETQYAPTLDGQLKAYRELADRRTLAACAAALPKAIEKGARESAREILVQAERAGLTAEQAEEWDRKIERMTAKADAKVAVPGRNVLTDLLAERAQITLDAEQELRGWELLRAALRRDPTHEEARDILDEIAPSHWRIGHQREGDGDDEMWQQRIWLDWQIEILSGGVRALGRLAPDMQRARTTWRKDLNGVETREEGSEIVFATPLNNARIVGLCVRYARLTCRALGRMFATDTPKREDNIPLVIYFYENKAEYVSGGRGGPPNPFLAMTAGYYTPGENISRFFWPGRHPEPERSIRDTFVHELTHHWIERRNPRWHARDLTENRVKVPGYWVVEGFATFIEEGRYDVRTYKWTHFNPKANSLDIVADLSRQKKLIAWDKEYTLTQEQFHGDGVSKKGIFATAKKKWALHPQPLNEIRLFYEQAASTCHFLYWGENGRYRQRLLDYVTHFYTGHKDKTDIEAGFGLTGEELGKRVEAYAKAVMDGWRPEGE